MPDLPTGTVTLLFTDIEGSTQLHQRLGARYGDVLAEYRQVLRSVFEQHHGQEVDTQGDSFFVAFSRAMDAARAAVEIQRALAEHALREGVRMATRMGLHAGEPQRWPAPARRALDKARAAGARTEGQAMALEDAIAYALGVDKHGADDGRRP